jgi:hypothetical protein
MKKKDRSEKRKQTILSVIIVVIMVSSVLGIMVNRDSDPNTFEYNLNNQTFKFGKYYNRYYLTSEYGRIYFYNLPDQLRVNLSESISTNLKNSQMLYITFNPEGEDLSYIDLARLELTEEYIKNDIYFISGKIQESDKYPSLPLIDCNNATFYTPVIKFERSNITEIETEGNCIIMKGRGLDFVRYRDLLVYNLYGVL